MQRNEHKLPYIAPELEVFDYVVERGFAHTETHGVTSSSQDRWSEITFGSNGDGGENNPGDWMDDTEW